MKPEELKKKIVAANSAYRSGTPTMSDQAFDDLVDEYEKLVSADEFNAFRDSLHEVKGKVKHPFIMGSLDKIKAEDQPTMLKFLLSLGDKVNVSAKVDGISCRLHYEKGKLVSASTRGNGEYGEDITDKIFEVNGVPNILRKTTDTIDIRGELVIVKDDFEQLNAYLEKPYANARNAVAGIMNKKDWTKNEVRFVSFIAYTILGKKFTKSEQFDWLLKSNSFIPAWHEDIELSKIENPAEWFFNKASADYPYDTDGLVVCAQSYINEDKYRPDMCKAYKINQLVAETTVIDVKFEGPSKGGLFVPVAILEPVNLGGAMISRCTLHNVDNIETLGLKYGSRVKLVRSGDVIPKILTVVSTPANAVDVQPPTECSACGSKLVLDGVNWRCVNPDCGDQKLHQAVHFIKKLGVKSASEATFKKFGISNIRDLLKFKADLKKKSEKKLADELEAKVFVRDRQKLLAAMNFDGLGETLVNKIVDFYGYDNIKAGNPYIGLPSGIGESTLQKFKNSIQENLETVDMFINDKRYNCLKSSGNSLSKSEANKNGMSVCFTGKLETMSRNDASEKAEAAGFEVLGGVKKGLTYLVTNTPDSGSSKNRKAQELGVKVIDEQQFLALCRKNSVAGDVFSI